MRLLSAASSSGVNLLKSGANTRGHAQVMSSVNAIHTSHATSHQRGPADAMIQSTQATSRPPSTRPSAQPFSWSATKTPGLVRLKPKRCSSRKVRKTEKGSASRLSTAMTPSTCSVPATSGDPLAAAASRPIAAMPPPRVSHRSTRAS